MTSVYVLGALVAVCAAYPVFALPCAFAALMVWASSQYGQRLKAQMARESNTMVSDPFIQRSDAPKLAWIAPYPLLLVGGAVVVGLTTLVFSGLTHIMVWAAGWSSYLPLEEAPLWAFLTVLGAWYGLLVLVVEAINTYVMKGRIFKSYDELVTYVRSCRTPEEVLGYAPVLRHAAKKHIRSPYDVYRIWSAWRAQEDHTAYYRSERLLETLVILEQRFPHESTDERFKQRYWSYARSIYRLLNARDRKMVDGSLFARYYSSLLSNQGQERDLDHHSATPMLSSELRVTGRTLN